MACLVVRARCASLPPRQNVFHLVKLGGFAVVPCRVLMMLSRTLMELAQHDMWSPLGCGFCHQSWVFGRRGVIVRRATIFK
jgi:hypothetical protein